LDGAIGSSSRTFDILKEIRDARFDQPAKTVPVMDASDHCAWLLFADYAKDSWENSARTDCYRCNVESVRLPIIRSDAVLFGACAPVYCGQGSGRLRHGEIWSAAASAARRRFGLRPVEAQAAFGAHNKEKRRRAALAAALHMFWTLKQSIFSLG